MPVVGVVRHEPTREHYGCVGVGVGDEFGASEEFSAKHESWRHLRRVHELKEPLCARVLPLERVVLHVVHAVRGVGVGGGR